MKTHYSLLLTGLLMAGCAAPQFGDGRPTRQRIDSELGSATRPTDAPARRGTGTDLPAPELDSNSLLPPLGSEWIKPSDNKVAPRFDLVVTDAPLSSVLSALAEDTPYSIMVKPRMQTASTPQVADRITLKLKNVTLFETLDTLREIYGYDYQIDGQRIYIQAPELQARLYQVNYVVGQRRGVSDLQVIGGASRGAGAAANAQNATTTQANSGGAASYASLQASALSTLAKADLWGELEDALRTILACQIPRKGLGGMSAAGGHSSRADVSFPGDQSAGERMSGIDGCGDGKALTINPMTGTILVRAMPRDLSTVEKMLRAMQINVERQVIIEAKIIDVELNDGAQQGVNWALFSNGLSRFGVGSDASQLGMGGSNGGTVSAQTSLGNLLGNGMIGSAGANAFSAGLGMSLQIRNFAALINFLQTQGQVHVLSSPRIATLNNQKAVLKVGSEEPYVTGVTGGTTLPGTGGSATIVTPPTLQYQPFFSGIALDVTPQIDADDNITLHVHTLVNHIVEKLKISQPSASAVYVPFASNTINEADSVVRTRDGQMIVIGGLMSERTEDDRKKIPGAGDLPVAGALFSKSAQKTGKRELVILLKPTVVKSGQVWSDAIGTTRSRLNDFELEQPGMAR